LKLATLMPRYEGEEQLLAVPLVLTMGWTNSPPTFCAASETVADLANANLFRRTVPPHRLEHLASAHDVWQPPAPGRPPSPSEPSQDDLESVRDSPGPPSCGRPLSPAETTPDQGPLSSGRPMSPFGTNLPPPRPPPEDRPPLLKLGGPVAHVDVFVDDFIGVAQGS
jgi:hypothetical protein